MRVADFFCGSGGFSEGFRQAGFTICFAVDKWEPAVRTYKGNKPSCIVKQDDVIRLSNLPDAEFNALIPDTEIIIGSPPCVAFSNSNKSGNGDKTLGLQLLEAYLRIVARKKYKGQSRLKYWILENVPNVKKHLKDTYSASDLGLEGDFSLHVINESSGVYNAKYFGAPTNRKRYLCGEFPAPKMTHKDDELVTLKDVLQSLGTPLSPDAATITDCNYPSFSLPYNDVSDHQYLYYLQPFEWKTSLRLKQDKGYMGRMSFPENIEKPARTVMATMTASSREAMILGTADHRYRLPTVREAASMMSFPIDYKFFGDSKGIKHTLVGNAVPPKLSYALAKAIATKENLPIPNQYMPICHDRTVNFVELNYANMPNKVERPKREIAKFKYHIPYLIVAAYRVELTNYHSSFKDKSFVWNAEIHYSQGKSKAQKYTMDLALSMFSEKKQISQFIVSLNRKLCSHNDFQIRYCMTEKQRQDKSLMGPYELLDEIKKFLEEKILREKWANLVEVEVEPQKLPYVIAAGYYILDAVISGMEE